MDKIRRPFRLKQVLRKFWRNHVADECPDEKETHPPGTDQQHHAKRGFA
jgi:hypothetical protein